MSTSIKRIALVAVAALGLGVVSVAPSTAAQTAAQSYVYCYKADGGTISNTTTTGATCGGIAGSSNFVTLKGVQTTKDVELTVSGSTFVASTSGFVTNAAGTVALAAAAGANGEIKVATPSVGTITVSVKYSTAGSGIFTASTETVVITVVSTALSGIYSAEKSSVYLVAGETSTASADATTAPTADKTYVAVESATASIVVKYLDGLGKAITGESITATITSGPGTILTGANAGVFDSTTAGSALENRDSIGSYTASADVDANGVIAFYLFRNGQAGTSVVTIKNAAGTILGSKSVVFTDTTVASITPTVLKNYVQGDAATATTNVIKLVLKDNLGNTISTPAAYPTVTSSDATIGTGTQSTVAGVSDTATGGTVFWGVTPAAAGKYGKITLTFKVGTVTATADVTLSSKKAATFTATAANTAANGDVVYTITAADEKGYAVPDGTALSTYVASVASVGTAGSLANQTALTSTSKSGVWTTTAVAAPSSSTDITTTFTLSGTKDTADANFVKALAGTDVTAKFSVNNPAIDAATEAAASAEAAANEAIDAALDAAEAADDAASKAQEAIDAVATLSAEVTKLINDLKTQIKTLSNLVAKIAKKVKA